MRDVTVTVVGNVGGDPVVRETRRGRVSNFTLGATRRVWDRESAGWVDGPTSWFRVACWNQLGANVAESVRRGERVVVVGRLEIRSYADRDGVERVRAEIQADHVGHELSFGVTRFMRVVRSMPLTGQAGDASPGRVGSGAGAGGGGGVGAAGREDPAPAEPDRPADFDEGDFDEGRAFDDGELDELDGSLDEILYEAVPGGVDGMDGSGRPYDEVAGGAVTTEVNAAAAGDR